MIVAAGVVIVLVLLLAMPPGRPAGAVVGGERALPPAGGALLEPFTSPFREVSDLAWTRYVRAMATGRPHTITPDGRVGIFGMELRRLEDIGLVRDVRRVERDGRTSFEMEWAEPSLSLERFLHDGALQYKAFARSAADQRTELLTHYRAVVGRRVDGKTATLSGLLGVAHEGGLGGLAVWLSGDADPTTQAQLSSVFGRTTGIF
jgi:hypothetical protein